MPKKLSLPNGLNHVPSLSRIMYVEQTTAFKYIAKEIIDKCQMHDRCVHACYFYLRRNMLIKEGRRICSHVPLGGLDVAEIPGCDRTLILTDAHNAEMKPSFTSTSSCRPGRGIKIIPLSTQQSAYHGREFVVEKLLLIRMKQTKIIFAIIDANYKKIQSSHL